MIPPLGGRVPRGYLHNPHIDFRASGSYRRDFLFQHLSHTGWASKNPIQILILIELNPRVLWDTEFREIGGT